MFKSFILLNLIVFALFSCQDDPIQPTPPTPPNPVDTTDTSGTNGYTQRFILEFYNGYTNGTGYNLYQTVDSIRFTNVTNGDTEKWLGSDVTWSNFNYPYNGNYHVFYVPTPNSGDVMNLKVYFNTNEFKGCVATYNEYLPGMNIGNLHTGNFTAYEAVFYN